MRSLLVLAAVLLTAFGSLFAEEAKTPVELGDVAWMRDFDEATKRAKKEQKPLLILFQEVPG